MTFRNRIRNSSGAGKQLRPVHFSVQIPAELMARINDVGVLNIDWSEVAAKSLKARLETAEKALEKLRKGS